MQRRNKEDGISARRTQWSLNAAAASGGNSWSTSKRNRLKATCYNPMIAASLSRNFHCTPQSIARGIDLVDLEKKIKISI